MQLSTVSSWKTHVNINVIIPTQGILSVHGQWMFSSPLEQPGVRIGYVSGIVSDSKWQQLCVFI
jgi:hypothetical protein